VYQKSSTCRQKSPTFPLPKSPIFYHKTPTLGLEVHVVLFKGVSKEPYIPSKEPYIPSKEPSRCIKRALYSIQRAIEVYEKSPIFHPKSHRFHRIKRPSMAPNHTRHSLHPWRRAQCRWRCIKRARLHPKSHQRAIKSFKCNDPSNSFKCKSHQIPSNAMRRLLHPWRRTQCQCRCIKIALYSIHRAIDGI